QANYERLKKNFDCRFGVVTQMMIGDHVLKNNKQYISNVCTKVNAKLGGYTARIAQPNPKAPPFRVPTMFIGVDVSHPSVGSFDNPSMAAITMSSDNECVRYSAVVQTNGKRVEIVAPHVIKETIA